MSILHLPRSRSLDLSHPQIMGIVNVTPDSFSDGGRFYHVDDAVSQALTMLEQGASIIDIGGESTRPNAPQVTTEQELERVIPVIEELRKQSDCAISIDTSKPQVMQAAAQAGADIINDVRALQTQGALEMAAKLALPVCLMHMQGQPSTMQNAPHYENLIAEINTFFQQRITACKQAGIKTENIILDVGFGFGKTLSHNYQLLAEFEQFCQQGYPVLAGLSRKSMFGKLLNKPPEQCVAASLAGALLCAQKGAAIIRVHDVAPTHDVLKVLASSQHPHHIETSN